MTSTADAPAETASSAADEAETPVPASADQTPNPAPQAADTGTSQSAAADTQTREPAAAETNVASASASSDLIGYTSNCEEGVCGQFYHTTPTLERQVGAEQLFTVERIYELSNGEQPLGPEPLQVMCSTDRPMVIKAVDAAYVIFHIAPH